MIDFVDADVLWANLGALTRRIDGQSMRKLRHLAERERQFPGQLKEAAPAGVLSDATIHPGLMAHVTAEPHAPATQGMDAYGPFPDACSARAALAEHFACDAGLIVIRFEPVHLFLGAYVPGAPALALKR